MEDKLVVNQQRHLTPQESYLLYLADQKPCIAIEVCYRIEMTRKAGERKHASYIRSATSSNGDCRAQSLEAQQKE